MIKHFGYNFKIAIEAIIQNKLRSVLTSLGIIFGVSSVIAMLAIGSGAEQAILEKMKLLGTNNIIIVPIDREKQQEISDENEENKDKKESTGAKFTPGLTLDDLEAITKIVKSATYASPEIIYDTDAMHSGVSAKIKLVGILPEYFKINNFSLNKVSLTATFCSEFFKFISERYNSKNFRVTLIAISSISWLNSSSDLESINSRIFLSQVIELYLNSGWR
jgi:ABC-type antimicrobial peptide transport system permease subunit